MPYQKRILSKLKVQPPVTNSMDKGRHMKIHDNCKTRIMALRLVWVEKSPRHNPENIFPQTFHLCRSMRPTYGHYPLAAAGKTRPTEGETDDVSQESSDDEQEELHRNPTTAPRGPYPRHSEHVGGGALAIPGVFPAPTKRKTAK